MTGKWLSPNGRARQRRSGRAVGLFGGRPSGGNAQSREGWPVLSRELLAFREANEANPGLISAFSIRISLM